MQLHVSHPATWRYLQDLVGDGHDRVIRTSTPESIAASPQSGSILLIDDEPIMHALVAGYLHAAGYARVVTATSVAAGIKLLQAAEPSGEWPPSLILMDLHLPGVSGIEGVRQIKAQANFHDIPIIMITGTDDERYLAASFEAGAVDYITKPPRRIELLARIASALRLKAELDQRHMLAEELEQANTELAALSATDTLLSIPNRRRFDELFDAEWRRALRTANSLALLMVDIDHFKLYNDTFGHLRGDLCLRQIAQVLRQSVRRAGDVVARYGGEEFGVILPSTNKQGALRQAERMRKNVADLQIVHPRAEPTGIVTISIGLVASIPVQPDAGQTLIEYADRALYEAKQRGRNQVVLGEIPRLPI